MAKLALSKKDILEIALRVLGVFFIVQGIGTIVYLVAVYPVTWLLSESTGDRFGQVFGAISMFSFSKWLVSLVSGLLGIILARHPAKVLRWIKFR